MQAVVMAGGAGTRLRPLTTAVPKALLPIVGEPMLERVVRLLSEHGVDRCVVTLQHQASVILKYFGTERVADVNLRFLTEPRPLGTAGSVRYAQTWLDDDDILVISGDCLTDMDLRELQRRHVEADADLTIALAHRADPRSYGVVSIDGAGNVMSMVEKPSWGEVSDDTVNTGVYIVSPRVLDSIPIDEPSDWAHDVIPALLARGSRVIGVVTDAYWEDVGTFASYSRAQRDVLDGRVHCTVNAFEVAPGVLVATGAELSPDADVRPPVYIGPFAKIEAGAVIGPYTVVGTNALIRSRAVVDHTVLHPNVFVGNDADLRGSIVGRASEVRIGARVLEGSVIADGCTIMDGAVIGTDVMIYPGKTIDEGSVVDESVVWESPSQRQVFSDSGVRGIVNVDMTPERIVRLAAAFATTLPKGATVTVGRDHSRAARALNRALAGALTAAGINLRDLRAVTTALVRNDTARYSDGGVILRTTPGRPDSIDVLFLNAQGGEITSHQRESIERIFTRKEFRRPLPSDIGDIRTPHRVLDDYANDVEAVINMEAIRKAHPRIVLDAGGGPSVGVLSMIMGRLGLDALTVGAAMEEEAAADQAPFREAALRRLSGLVVSSGARIGARLGPTGERLSIVDELGRVIEDGRMLLIMLDLMAASRHSGCVAVPVTTSRLAEEVAAYHGTAVRRIGAGPAALAAAAVEPDVILAGDGRGRFVLPALGPGPDAISSLMMLLSLMADTELSLSQLNSRIPATSVVSRTVTVPWHRRAGAMRAVRQQAEGTQVDTLDGIRATEDDGSWCLILPEDDQACLTLYAEASDAPSAGRLLDRWQAVVESAP
jgi:mannose-1-phosphate guanylyltransferase / phosphomannomutase